MKIADSSDVDTATDSIWYDGRNYATVTGYKTDDGIRTLKGNTGAAKAQGVATGYTEGTITENNTFFIGGSNACYAGDGNDIKIKKSNSKFVATGDSGGPVFTLDDSGDAHAIITVAVAQNKQGTVNCGMAQAYSIIHGYSVEALVKNKPFSIG